MKITWKHPYYECDIDVDIDYRHQRQEMLLELPVCDFSFKDKQMGGHSKKIAAFIPLFCEPHLKNGYTKGLLQFHGFIKHAFWLAHQLHRFSDLVEAQVDFYICIQDEFEWVLEPYRQICEFPKTQVWPVSIDPKIKGYLPKIAMLRDLCHKTAYDYYISMDSLLMYPNPHPLFQGIQNYWEQHPEHCIWAGSDWERDAFTNDPQVMEKLWGLYMSLPFEDEPFYKKMHQFFGDADHDTFKQRLRRRVPWTPTWFYGIPRCYIYSENFENLFQFVREHECLFHDGALMQLYWHTFTPHPDVYVVPKVLACKNNIELFVMKPDKAGIFHINNGRQRKEVLTYYENYVEVNGRDAKV